MNDIAAFSVFVGRLPDRRNGVATGRRAAMWTSAALVDWEAYAAVTPVARGESLAWTGVAFSIRM